MRWQGSLSKEETVLINKEWVKIKKEYWDFIVMGHFALLLLVVSWVVDSDDLQKVY